MACLNECQKREPGGLIMPPDECIGSCCCIARIIGVETLPEVADAIAQAVYVTEDGNAYILNYDGTAFIELSGSGGSGGGSNVTFVDNGDGTGTLTINGISYPIITEQYNDSILVSEIELLSSENELLNSELSSLIDEHFDLESEVENLELSNSSLSSELDSLSTVLSELLSSQPIVILDSDSEVIESIELEDE